MPRKARIEAPGALHHVIIRGIEKRKIFWSDKELVRYIHLNPLRAGLGTTLEEYDFNWVVFRVAELTGMDPEEVTAFGKSPRTVKARALFCYWAHRKLGMTATEIAKRLKIGQPAVSRLSKRGQQIEKEREVHLIRK